MAYEWVAIFSTTCNSVIARGSKTRIPLSAPSKMHLHSEVLFYVDCCCRGLGAGAGNTQTKVLCAVLKRMGYNTGVNLYDIQDVAEDLVEPIMRRPQVIRTDSMMLGYAGVYSSFLLHTRRAVEKFGLSPRDILVELGRRVMVGGQEDMIIDVAYQMAQEKKNN